MAALFLKLVNMSITASYLVIAVVLLRLLLKKAPRWLHAALWGLVGLRLVLPFSFESILSLIPSAEPLPEEFLYAATPQIQTGIPAVNNRLNPIIAQSLTPEGLTSANPTQILSAVFANVWLIGLAVMLIYAMVSYLIIRRRVAAFIPMGKCIRICDDINTPFILGIIRPKIYLPSSLDEATAVHVLSHEKAHLTRKDHWWKPLGYLLLCVYWFNPLIWIAYILLCRDIEMACNEKVIRDMDPLRKKAYSNALLSCSVPRRLIAACPLAFGEVGVKDRIKSVLNYKKPAFWVIVVAVIASIVVAVCFLTDPAGRPLTYLSGDNTNPVMSVTVASGDDTYGVYTEKGIENVLAFLKEVRISSGEISQDRSEDRDATHTITLHYERIDCRYCFSEDFTEVWYDNGVKPTLTHQVRNPEQVSEFFPIAMEAPAADRLEPGEYMTEELVYWPLYSSMLPPYDTVYSYTVTEKAFFFENGTAAANIYWQWRRVADCADELKFFFDWYDDLADVLELPAVTDSSKYQKIDENHHLFLVDGLLYLVEGFDSGTPLTNVAVIYRLANKDDVDVPVSYPESTVEGQENQLYSTISGQVYDVRSAQDMLIRNAVLENNPMSGSVSFESHQVLSEMVGCGAEAEEGAPVGFTAVDVIAVVMHAPLNQRTIPASDGNYQIINATITYERYADGTYIPTEYQENDTGDMTDYNMLPLYQHCCDQAVKYWGLDTHLMVDSLLDTISASPAQYSYADAYIQVHQAEYNQLLFLGEYSLSYCFDAFLNNRASGIRAEIMAAACRDIAKSMGENIDFEGQYVNGPTWFDAFHANALELYDANGLDALEKTNPASWLLLNMIGQTPDPIPDNFSAEIVDSEHHTNAISLHVDVKFPDSIDVGAIDEIPTPESVLLNYTSARGDQSISPTSSVTELVDEQTNTIHYHFIFKLYEREPMDSNFSLTMSGFPEMTPDKTLSLGWQADVDDARVFTAKSGDSEVTLTISPYLVNVEFTNSDYDSLSGLYDSIQIRDTDGRLLPIRGPYGGGESAYSMDLSITLLEPVDIDAIETVKVGGLILK